MEDRDLREEFRMLFIPKINKEASIKDNRDDLEIMMDKLASNIWDRKELEMLTDKMASNIFGSVKTPISAVEKVLPELSYLPTLIGRGLKSGARVAANALGKVPGYVGAAGAGIGGMMLLSNYLENQAAKNKAQLLDQSFEGMYSEYPVLKNVDPLEVQKAFNVLAKIAPDMADNSTIAGAYVVNKLENPGMESQIYNPDALATLASTQKAITDTRMKARQGVMPVMSNLTSFIPPG